MVYVFKHRLATKIKSILLFLMIIAMSANFFPMYGDETVTIRVPSWWFGEPANKDWLAEVIEVFETKHPNIKVDGYNLPYGEYADTLLVEIAAGDPPDVVHLLNMNIGDFQRIDALQPLDKYLAHSNINPYNFTPAQFQPPMTYNGSTYGVIHMVANYIPFYNKQLLEEAGYSSFPENSKDFFEMVGKLSNPPNQFGYAAMVKPGSYVETYMDITQWVVANEGGWATAGKPTIDSEKNIEAVQAFKNMFDSGAMPKDVDKSTYRSMWWEGKVGVLFDGSWMMSFAKSNNPEIVPSLGTAQMPWPSRLTASAFQVWSIPEGASHPDEAWKFIEFMQSFEMQVKMINMTGCVSPRKGAMSKKFVESNPWFENFQLSADKYAVSIMPQGLELYGNEVLKIIADQVQQILYRDTDVASALAVAQKKVEKLVAN